MNCARCSEPIRKVTSQRYCKPCYVETHRQRSRVQSWQYPCREYVRWITRPAVVME